MNISPFKYGTTVSADYFTNREKELKKLYNNLTQGINTTIISPRRWGKSSLVEKVVRNLLKSETEVKIAVIDLFSVSSEQEFLELFAKEIIKSSSSKWDDWIKSGKIFFTHLIPKISFGIDPDTDFSLSFDWEALKLHRDEILDLPEIISKKKNVKFIICLDEFQNLATFQEYEVLEKRMRAIWQRQKNCCYCLYGSKRHMMTDIFNNPSKPFYRFGDLMLLEKIRREKWVEFIHEGFLRSKKDIDAHTAELIPEIMKNHPWYVQQLAHYTWQKTKKKAGEKELLSALNEVIQANTPFYQKEVETISTTQLNLLKAIAEGETMLTSARVMQKYRLGTPRNVSKNKIVLENSDIVELINGGYEFLDPAFEKWFRKQFLNQNYF